MKYKNGIDYEYPVNCINVDKNGIPILVYVFDKIISNYRTYKLYENTKGSYFVFHGQRVYCLEK